MKLRHFIAGMVFTALSSAAIADLTPWEDYEVSEGVSNVTTIKVDSNMIDKYLEGLATTWAPTNDIAVELGQIESYNIYVSDLPNSGDFNVVLVVQMENAAALQPTKARFDAFMAKWSKESQKESDAVVVTYPNIRTITGEYLLREITFK